MGRLDGWLTQGDTGRLADIGRLADTRLSKGMMRLGSREVIRTSENTGEQEKGGEGNQ